MLPNSALDEHLETALRLAVESFRAYVALATSAKERDGRLLLERVLDAWEVCAAEIVHDGHWRLWFLTRFTLGLLEQPKDGVLARPASEVRETLGDRARQPRRAVRPDTDLTQTDGKQCQTAQPAEA